MILDAELKDKSLIQNLKNIYVKILSSILFNLLLDMEILILFLVVIDLEKIQKN